MARTSLQDRVLIMELSDAGATARQIAERLGWSLATVRKWRRPGHQAGRAGLASRLGRPPHGALSTFPPVISETLRAWRTAHPGWGPTTLRAELARTDALAGQPLPSRSRIAHWLQAEGLTRRYARHQPLPQPVPPGASAPHVVWEVDARGHDLVPEVGVISLINLTDRYSKVKLLSYPCLLGRQRVERHPTTADYQLVLRQAFLTWGLPDHLAVDRDSVFYDNSSPSPFPTRLHLWLLALDVVLVIGPPGRPTVRATIERAHQLWYHQVVEGQTFPTWEALAAALDRRRDFLNWHLPCATTGQQPPLVACPAAAQPRRPYRPDWEAALLDVTRVYQYLQAGRWFRRASNRGAIRLGDQRYVLGRAWAHAEVEITFDPTDQQLVCRAADGTHTRRCPLQGLTPTALMGEAGPLAHLDGVQLALPFSWPEWQVLRLCETVGVTN